MLITRIPEGDGARRQETVGELEMSAGFDQELVGETRTHRPYTSDAERQAAFTAWLDWYNYHRPHTGISGHTPASRVTNLTGQYT
ncbi:integrase core domain-containing protein [Streptomyces chrestomyceticus]